MKNSQCILLVILFLNSCATSGDFDTLRSEVKSLQAANRETTEILSKFVQKYDSQLRDELEKNITKIQSEINRLEGIKVQASEDANLISRFRGDSEKDSLQTAVNRRESDAQNVVREFNSLRITWEQHLNEMRWMTETAQKAASDSHSQTQAAKLSVLAVEDKLSRMEILAKKLNEWSGQFESWSSQSNLQSSTLRNLSRDLNSINATLDSLRNRLETLEKATQ